MSQGRPLCRYFASGCCIRDNCTFLHDRAARPDNVCRYYLQGQCFYGDGCRYDHIAPERHGDRHRILSRNNHHIGAILKSRMQSATSGDSTVNKENITEPYVPPSSYARAVDRSVAGSASQEDVVASQSVVRVFCQYAMSGTCPIGDTCEYFHGEICDICHCQVLDPENEQQRANHEKLCMEAMERDMEFSFAVQRSAEKVCSICMDNVLDKGDVVKQRFGILENCGHTFCHECIMNWRKQSKETMDNSTLRSCPECRIHSDYVVPSKLWPESKEDRDKVIADYKKAMGKKPCKHFDLGKGKCPFGGSCWFLHALKDGTKVTLPVPKPRRRVFGEDGETAYLNLAQMSDYLAGLSDEDDEDDEDDDDILDIYPDMYDHAYYDDDFADSDDEEGDSDHLTYAGMMAALSLLPLNNPGSSSGEPESQPQSQETDNSTSFNWGSD